MTLSLARRGCARALKAAKDAAAGCDQGEVAKLSRRRSSNDSNKAPVPVFFSVFGADSPPTWCHWAVRFTENWLPPPPSTKSLLDLSWT